MAKYLIISLLALIILFLWFPEDLPTYYTSYFAWLFSAPLARPMLPKEMKLLRNCLGPCFKVTLSFLETLSTSRLLDKLSLCYFIPEAWTASAFFCACILVTHNISSPSLNIVPAVLYMSSPVGKNWDANTESAIHSKTCMRITTSRISAKVFFPLAFPAGFLPFLRAFHKQIDVSISCNCILLFYCPAHK